MSICVRNLACLLLLIFSTQIASAQTTAFTYQGKLTDTGAPATGGYDFQFKLFDLLSGGVQQGTTQTATNVTVSNGIFSVNLDFGVCATCFNGGSRFLEIAAKPTGGGSFTPLAPRQPITSTPYAIKSQNASTADGLSVACINCVTSSQIGSVNGSAVTGSIPVGSVPSGSANYIQNGASPQASSSFNISGTGAANILNATTQFNINGLRAFTVNGAYNDLGRIFAASNTFAGERAGVNTTPDPLLTGINGKFNSFFGALSGQANSTGSENSFFGIEAGLSNTTGEDNAFVGFRSGFSNTTGNDNAFFGPLTGFANTTGQANTFMGFAAGDNNTTGASNVFLGLEAGFRNTTGNNNTFVGRSANFISTNSTGNKSSGFGFDAAVQFNVSNATAIGAQAFVGQSNSLVLGSISGLNGAIDDTSVGIGTSAPVAVLDVQRDSGAIPETARFTTYGAANEILGRASNGTRDLPSATPSGRVLLQLGATGHDGANFVSNPKAMVSLDASEAWSGSANGTRIRFLTTTIGTTATATRMTITDDGSVGIGTAAPDRRLHIFGAGDQEIGIESSDAGGRQWTLQSASGASTGRFEIIDRTASLSRMTILSTGLIGIGTTAPADKLHVAGDIRVGTGSTGCVKDANGTVISGTCSSDARLKHDITPFPKLLDKLVRLQPVTFYWNTNVHPIKSFGAEESFGLVAQDVEQVMPELVTQDEQGYKAVRYNKLPLLTLQAIKELKADNDALQHQNDILQGQVSKIQNQLEALKSLVCIDHPNAAACR